MNEQEHITLQARYAALMQVLNRYVNENIELQVQMAQMQALNKQKQEDDSNGN